MWPGTANSGGCRSPQAFAGTRTNTREPVRSDKKKPQLRTVGVLILVAESGIEPASALPTREQALPAKGINSMIWPKCHEPVQVFGDEPDGVVTAVLPV